MTAIPLQESFLQQIAVEMRKAGGTSAMIGFRLRLSPLLGRLSISKVGVLEMQRDRVVEAGADAGFVEFFLEGFPVAGADDVQVVDRAGPFGFVGDNDAGEEFVVASGSGASFGVPVIQVAELDSQKTGLDCIEAAVVAFEVVVVLFGLTVVSQHLDLLATSGSLVVTAPPSPQAPRFLPGKS